MRSRNRAARSLRAAGLKITRMRPAAGITVSGFLSARERVVCFNVRKLGWYALRVTVAAFVLGGVLLLAANLYVQSHGVQQRIREAVEANLKLPVHLQKTTVTPWEGLRLDGIAFRAKAAEDSGAASKDRPLDFFTAASFRVRFAWWPFLSRRQLVIERVLLDRPRLVWQQDDDGRWSFPPGQDRVHQSEAEELARENTGVTGPTAGLDASTTAPADTPPSLGTTPPPGSRSAIERRADEAAEASRFKGFPVPVNNLHVRHGQMDFLNREHRPLFRVEELNSDGAVKDAQHAQGAFWFAKASVPSTGIALTNYCTAVDFGIREGLALHDGQGTLAGGSVRTDFRVQPQALGQTFAAACNLDHVALGQLMSSSGDLPPLAEGQFNGTLECHGFTDDPTSRSGGGRLWLVGARLRESAPLKLVGQLLRISDLTQLEFKQADVQYKVAGTTVRIDSLVLAANDIRINAHGVYRTEANQLDVHGRLTIDQAVSHQLPQFIESNFTPCGPEAAGCRYLDFDVTGPADDPKSNLYDRLMAGPMKGLLDNLLAPKSKNPKNKPRGNESVKTPTGSPHLP